jgi:hypothetical protein
MRGMLTAILHPFSYRFTRWNDFIFGQNAGQSMRKTTHNMADDGLPSNVQKYGETAQYWARLPPSLREWRSWPCACAMTSRPKQRSWYSRPYRRTPAREPAVRRMLRTPRRPIYIDLHRSTSFFETSMVIYGHTTCMADNAELRQTSSNRQTNLEADQSLETPIYCSTRGTENQVNWNRPRWHLAAVECSDLQ